MRASVQIRARATAGPFTGTATAAATATDPFSPLCRLCELEMRKRPQLLVSRAGVSKRRPATTYSPTESPLQYHPRDEA